MCVCRVAIGADDPALVQLCNDDIQSVPLCHHVAWVHDLAVTSRVLCAWVDVIQLQLGGVKSTRPLASIVLASQCQLICIDERAQFLGCGLCLCAHAMSLSRMRPYGKPETRFFENSFFENLEKTPGYMGLIVTRRLGSHGDPDFVTLCDRIRSLSVTVV